jgi:hypothetical protein
VTIEDANAFIRYATWGHYLATHYPGLYTPPGGGPPTNAVIIANQQEYTAVVAMVTRQTGYPAADFRLAPYTNRQFVVY